MRHKQHRNLKLESLERREVFSATVLEAEPNDRLSQATPAAAPADGEIFLAGSVASRIDRDFFTFRAPASGPAQVSVEAAAGRTVKLEFTNVAGQELFENEPNDGVNEGVVELVAGQRYFVRLRSNERGGPVSYTVHLQLQPGAGGETGGETELPPPGDSIQESEPNDRKGLADRFQLAAGGAIRLMGETSKRDRDFFAFTAPTSGKLQAMVFSAPRQRVQFTVEDAAGNKVFETEPNNGVHGGAMDVVAGVTYYFRVRGAAEESFAYSVDLALTELMGG